MPVGTPIAVPEHFYQRIESAEAMPASYAGPKWAEGHFGNWLEASRAHGPEAIQSIVERLGPPLRLSPWPASGGAVREAYVYALGASPEAGVIILLDRPQARVVMRIYTSWLLPMHIRPTPPGLEWGAMLMTWFRWLTTPDDKLPPHIRAAGQSHPFTMTAKGEGWIMPGMHLPMIAGAAMDRPDVPRPGGKIIVPDQFYTPITDPADLPEGFGGSRFTEAPCPAPVVARAEGSKAVAAALQNLGPPLTLPSADGGAREAWVFALKASPEAGLIAALDRDAPAVELRRYAGDALPAHVPEAPTGHWWPPLLAAWWQAQVDPAFAMPPNGRFVDRPAAPGR